jgi:serine/threonine-protein kinase HipA
MDQHVSVLDVFYGGSLAGKLARNAKGEIWFEYDKDWIREGFPLSPMPEFALRAGAFKAGDMRVFYGLHGVFNDSLPDGWGLLLMDRALLAHKGWSRQEIGPLDRLAYLGSRAMGALEFRPPMEQARGPIEALSLDRLAQEATLLIEGRTDQVLNELYIHGGSPGGARPKVTVALSRTGDHCVSGFGPLPEGYDHWMVKFRGKEDPQAMGRIELAYARMAQAAGVDMPNTRLVSALVDGVKQDFFAVQRFDRVGDMKRHVVSVSGMLEVSHREPCMDYEEVLKLVALATRDVREVAKAYRLATFNVLAHNKDDHVKNFALIEQRGDWQLSPAYDLTFSYGMGGSEHMTSTLGEGQPSLAALRRLGERLGVDHAETIRSEVFQAVSAWPDFAAAQSVPQDLVRTYREGIEKGPAFGSLKTLVNTVTTMKKPNAPARTKPR